MVFCTLQNYGSIFVKNKLFLPHYFVHTLNFENALQLSHLPQIALNNMTTPPAWSAHGTAHVTVRVSCWTLKASFPLTVALVEVLSVSSHKNTQFDKELQKHWGFRQTVQSRIRWELKIDDPMGKLGQCCRKEKDKHNKYRKIKYRMWDHYVNTEVLLEMNFLEADY